jgi:hypothetical protein
MVCTDDNLAQRGDCLGLLPLLPAGSNGGLTAADCISGSSGTNADGNTYCVLANNIQCSLVMVFADQAAQSEPQSRDDIAAIINNSNAFCWRLCTSGPLEGSSIFNIDKTVRVCVIDSDAAELC